MRRGGTLLYSLANFMDLAKARPETQDSVLAYLEGFGDRWFPLNPIAAEVILREQAPTPGRPPCFDDALLTGAFPLITSKKERDRPYGSVSLRAYASQCRGTGIRKMVCDRMVEWGRKIQVQVEEGRRRWKDDPEFRKRVGSELPFDPARPTGSIYTRLTRSFYKGTFTFSENHLLDLIHTVVPIAYGTFVLLDGHWKEQVRQLGLPSPSAFVYDKGGLEGFLLDLARCPRPAVVLPQAARRNKG